MSIKHKDLLADLGFFDESIHGNDFCPLAMGAPGAETLRGCSELMLEATKRQLSNKSEEKYTFQYGPLRGDPDFREEMAKFLTQEYGDPVNSEDLFVTASCTQGLHLISTVMFQPNTPVFIEDPTFFVASKLLRDDLGMNLIPVPTDNQGIRVDILEELIIKHKPTTTNNIKSPFWSFVYTVPTFNNPKGYCMLEKRSRDLVKLARKYNVMLLAEDVYNLLHFTEGNCPKRLFYYDDRSDPDYEGHVVSNCTFSKILGPGLRLGWIEAPTRVMKCLEKSFTAMSGGSFNHYTSKIMTTALRDSLFQKHLKELRKEYGERIDILCDTLVNNLHESMKFDKPVGGIFVWLELPPLIDYNHLKWERIDILCDTLVNNLHESVKFNKPVGGIFVWLELPPLIDSTKLLELAVTKYKVNFITGPSTSPSGSWKNCVRLSVSFCYRNMVEKGAKSFCDAVHEMLS